jgi:hypothetical protein
MTGASTQGYAGQQDLSDGASLFNAFSFIVSQMLGRISTIKVVKVMKVTNEGDVSPVGFVDVQPLVDQIDQEGYATPHATIFGIPYFRLQGGANAVIIDPAVGDIGIAVFADRDISAVKVNKARSSPGSYRRFAEADGIYIGGILNGTPEQYVRFSADGMELHDKNSNALVSGAAGWEFTGAVKFNNLVTAQASVIAKDGLYLDGDILAADAGVYTGNFQTSGDVVAGTGTGDQVGLQSHRHTSAASGNPTSPPTPGT